MPSGDRANAPSAGRKDRVAYTEAGVEAARRLVSVAAGSDAAAAFALIARVRQDNPGQTLFALHAFDALGWPAAGLRPRLHQAANAFFRSFAMPLFSGLDDDSDGAPATRSRGGLEMAAELVGFLDTDPAAPIAVSALLDDKAKTWAEIVVAATRMSGGHHLGLRCADQDRHSVIDFAAHLAAAGVRVITWRTFVPLPEALLAAELYGGDNTVVVADGSLLVSAAASVVDLEFDAPGDASPLVANPLAMRLLPGLETARTTYVWRIPDRGELPAALRGLVAACFGPLRQDPGWQAAYLKRLAPDVAAGDLRMLLAHVGDARNAGAAVRMAAAVDAAGVASMSEVCRLIAGAGPQHQGTLAPEASFDASLVACDLEGQQLLECGQALAQGGRVLVYGPPGGGKTTFAKALAARIAVASGGGGPMMVEPASLLAKAWGGTERLISSLWQRAQQAAAPLVADEFDAMASVREADAPASGNAHLIRTMTTEWCRQIDRFASVTLIATVNDCDALDPAIRRRFPIAIEVRAELSADQELRAWAFILGTGPPPGWAPAGACIADYVAAGERCRLLGRNDAAAYATAIADARALRLGRARGAGRSKRKGGLH